jgi:hypothetical protein
MAEYRQNDAAIWVSKRKESAFNTPYTAGADFLKASAANPIVLIPEMEKRDDAGKAGNGHEFATYQCNTYWSPIAAALGDEVNFELFGRLALRAVGGTVTDTTLQASAAYKHAANMLPIASGLQLPSSTIISELGGASFLFPGCVVERFRMSQEGANPVQVAFDMIGSGKHRSPHAVTSLPATPTITQCLKAGANLSYTDGGGSVDLTTACRVRSWFVEIVNNHAPADDRCVGDPEQDAGDYTASGGLSSAAYNSKLSRGSRQVNAQIVILLDSTMPEWLQMAENEALTNITLGAKGPELYTAIDAALNVIIPQGRFRAVQEQDSNGKAALVLTLNAMYDATSGGAAKVEVVNAVANNYD